MSDMTVSDDLLREVVESVSGGDASVRNLLGLMMARELIKLRDQLRWRKWPEEEPETGGKYLVIWFDDAKGLWLDDIKVVQCNEPLRECFFKLGYFYWRPIGSLPKESEQ